MEVQEVKPRTSHPASRAKRKGMKPVEDQSLSIITYFLSFWEVVSKEAKTRLKTGNKEIVGRENFILANEICINELQITGYLLYKLMGSMLLCKFSHFHVDPYPLHNWKPRANSTTARLNVNVSSLSLYSNAVKSQKKGFNIEGHYKYCAICLESSPKFSLLLSR